MANEAQSLKISPTFSPQSPHENVKIGGQEFQQEQRLLNVQSEDVAGIRTKVPGNRTPRLNNRKKVLNQFEDKFITPSPPGTVKGYFPSPPTEQKGSAYFKAIAKIRSAKEAKSQQEFAALQTQVVSLTTTLNSVMAMLQTLTKNIPQEQSMKGNTPQILLSPLSTPISKVSFEDAFGSKTPSPTKSDGGKSAISSNHDDSTASSSRESAAAGSKHDGTTTSSPSCDGSPKGKFSASPKRSPPVVAPATVDKREMSTPLPSTPSLAKAAATKPASAKASKKKKGKAAPSMPKPSPSSSDESSSIHSDSTPDKESRSRRKARKLDLKAEKVTRALAANYQLIKLITENFTKLGISNYDSWRREWEQEINSLGYNISYISVDGPEWDIKTEDVSESVHRKNLAKMVIITIDPTEHELWLRGTDSSNPQALFRRMHLKFRGADTVAVSSQIESKLLTMSMKSTRLDIAGYGSAIVENLRRLTEMGVPMCEVKMVNLYLLGLNEVFDPIRFDIQKQIKNKKPKAPKTMADAKKIVEDWAHEMKDRGFVTFKDTSDALPMSSVLTMLGEVQSTTTTDGCNSPTANSDSCNADVHAFDENSDSE